MKVKTDYEGCAVITAGKVYKAKRGFRSDLARIIADDGGTALIRLTGCAYLEGRAWEVVDEGE